MGNCDMTQSVTSSVHKICKGKYYNNTEAEGGASYLGNWLGCLLLWASLLKT